MKPARSTCFLAQPLLLIYLTLRHPEVAHSRKRPHPVASEIETADLAGAKRVKSRRALAFSSSRANRSFFGRASNTIEEHRWTSLRATPDSTSRINARSSDKTRENSGHNFRRWSLEERTSRIARYNRMIRFWAIVFTDTPVRANACADIIPKNGGTVFED